ncbi:MAG: hypothetical protein R3330_14250, partial [Saprospiraceae bacterium]|nr:hypothetical protein [Saprospiraceae bacterium]
MQSRSGRTTDLSFSGDIYTASRELFVNRPSYWCWKVQVHPTRGGNTLVECPATELGNAGIYRQVLIMPTGYTATTTDYDQFRTDAGDMILRMAGFDSLFTGMHKDRILYVIYWIPGYPLPALNSTRSTANFGARIYDHPVRAANGLTLRNEDVVSAVTSFRSNYLSSSDPIAVVVHFNSGDTAASTPNAVMPSLNVGAGRDRYGIVRIDRSQSNSGRIPTHELAHAGLNFVDEYCEGSPGGCDLDIRYLDPFTSLLRLGTTFGSWFDTASTAYSVKLSEILANNGWDNVATTWNLPGNTYLAQGGMFFGKGVWTDEGANIMSDGSTQGRGTIHTASQLGVVQQ